MENVKPACSAALALTCADCGVTPVVLPWACSWNPISLLGYGACFSSRLWKLCPLAFSKMSIIPLKKNCFHQWWPGLGAFLLSHRRQWHICLITLDPLCSLLLDCVKTGKLESVVLSLEKRDILNTVYIKITAGYIKCHLHSLAGCMLLDRFQG